MPVSRDQVRKNLISLLQFQMFRQREYGDLLLAVWYGIEEEAQDVFLFEVFEKFASPEGHSKDAYRFPGMGNLWLPGLYEVTVYSRAEFERAARDCDPVIDRLRSELRNGLAEILWPQNAGESELARLILE